MWGCTAYKNELYAGEKGSPSSCKFSWQKANVALDVQPFRFTRWPFLTAKKLSSYADSVLAPQALSSFPSFAGCTAMTESRGTWEQDYSFSIQCKSESFLLMITALLASFPGLPTVQFLIICRIKRSNTGRWEDLRTRVITAKKQSPNKFFAAGGWLPCVQRTKLRAICNHYLKESMYSVC